MLETFAAVLITLGLHSSGVTEISRVQFASVADCEAAKYQKEFTELTPKGFLGVVFVCEWKRNKV